MSETKGGYRVRGGRPIAVNVLKLESLYNEDGRLRPGVNARVIIRILYGRCHWLTDADYPSVRTFAQLEIAASRAEALIESLMETGDEDKEPPRIDDATKLLTEYRQLRHEQSSLSDRLGLNPKARKSLGVREMAGEGEEDELD